MINVNEIKDFTLQILEKLGAKTEFINPDVFIANFPDSLSEEMGDKVYLSFTPLPPELEREINEFELVVPGSDFLEKLISLARKKGGGGQRFFLKHFYSPHETPGVNFFSATLDSLQKIPHYRRVMEFNFRIAFLSDEKIESIYSVYLDDNGENVDMSLEDPEEGSLISEPEEGISYSSSDISSQVEEIYEKAKEILLKKIQPQIESIEEEQKKHLSEAVARLETYYNRQKEYAKKKYKEEASAELEELSRELEQKKEELAEKHRLRTGVSLINFREVRVPYAGYQAVLLKGDRKEVIHFRRDLFKGRLLRPSCSSCKKETDSVTICKDEGHILGKCCISDCSICNVECCRICSPPEKCHICESMLCEDCRALCPVCKQVYCYERHRVKCGKCNEDFCLNCTVKCSKCGGDFCPGHVFFCSWCNKNFCSDHSGKCIKCGKEACEEHGSICPVCNKYTCQNCRLACEECKTYFCHRHISACYHCGKNFCTGHSGKCTECRKTVCIHDSKECPGCGLLKCNSHLSKCSLCRQEYCRACIKDKKKKLCSACFSLKKLENPDEIPSIFGRHISVLSGVPVLKLRAWKKGLTKDYIIFTASGFLSSYLFVIDRRDGSLVSHRSLGLWSVLKSLFEK